MKYEFIKSPIMGGTIKFIADEVGEGHTLGYISSLLDCELLSSDRIVYRITTEDLILLLIRITDERNIK